MIIRITHLLKKRILFGPTLADDTGSSILFSSKVKPWPPKRWSFCLVTLGGLFCPLGQSPELEVSAKPVKLPDCQRVDIL